MDSGMLDQVLRSIGRDEQRLDYLKALVAPEEAWISLREEIERVERQIDRQRARCSAKAEQVDWA